MSIKLELNGFDFNGSDANHTKLQYIPANVEEPSKTNIDSFFNNYTTETDGVLKNSLRGFPLNGCQFKVPESYQGVIFQESQRPVDENEDRVFKVSGIFNEFTYWNYDRQPSENDKLKQALQWNDFANALHNPVTVEQFTEHSNDSMDKENNKH